MGKEKNMGTHNKAGFPVGSDGKESACNEGGLGSISGLGRSPEEGNGSSLQHSCLENSMNRGAWQATVHRVAQSSYLVLVKHYYS